MIQLLLANLGIVFKRCFVVPCFSQGGRKRRWCVLRSYSPYEASLDIFMDDSKTRYKGSITLDREANPVMIVKTSEFSQRRKINTGYMVLKVGKNTYHFTSETLREMTEWCALIRQSISDGEKNARR